MAKISTDRLPALPNPNYCDDGYDWMGKLSEDWTVLPTWDGEDMGDWPYIVVASHDDHEDAVYGCVRYTEGDVFAAAWDTRRERDIALDTYHLKRKAWLKG